ncbi:hypothetical protein HN865_04315 [Candidatus Woesearchaeota archaeon]|jgi:hypothetical protein|nr:hypothetical protein [Candidatus Woesearchaeota archaeon]MBT7238052.1 hypothetical protein [Candidatus Woesearchaeota archaeon]
MKQTKFTKIITLFAIFLILLNTVSALKISTSEINDVDQGDNVYFDVEIGLSRIDIIQLVNDDIFIRHAKLTITGPNGFYETCFVKDGQLVDCDLDLSVKEVISQNKDQITYQFVWNTLSGIEKGTYNVNGELYLTKTLDAQYSYCDILVGRYQALSSFDHVLLYDSTLDLNNDNIVNLSDLVIFQSNPMYRQDGELFGRFQGFFMLNKEYREYNSMLDLNEDGIINLSDLVLLSQELGNDKLDLNGDGIENLSDIVILAQYFETENLELDWNNDGIVNLSDIILITQYMENGNLELDMNGDDIFNLSDIVIISEIYSNSKISTEYERSLDLDGNGIVNLSDIIILAQNIEGSFELEDLNEDGILDLTETIIAANGINNEEWCAMQLEKIDGLVTIFNSEEQSFEITSRSSNGGSRNHDDDNSAGDDYQDYESGDEYEGTYTPFTETNYLMDNLWSLVFYLIAIIVSFSGIVIVSKKL